MRWWQEEQRNESFENQARSSQDEAVATLMQQLRHAEMIAAERDVLEEENRRLHKQEVSLLRETLERRCGVAEEEARLFAQRVAALEKERSDREKDRERERADLERKLRDELEENRYC